jgi:hypothetical protein
VEATRTCGDNNAVNFQMKNGILVPEKPLEPLQIFVDETFVLDRSGFLQAAFLVPRNVYDEAIVPPSRELLAKLGPEAKEFKGSAIKPGNVRIYREFLHRFVNVSALVADNAPLYPTVSLDGMGAYIGQQFDCVQFNVVGALNNLGIKDADKLAGEFSRQMLWLHRHLPTIAPRGFRNDAILVFDAKYLHAEQSQAQRFFTADGLIAPAVWTLEKALTSCANTLLSDERSDLRIENIGRVVGFRFRRSPEEFGLQAADVLSHLIYSALRDAMGISDANTSCKVQLLHEVMPVFSIDDDLRSCLSVLTGPDGRPDVQIINATMRSRFQILPA